jgi:hypothetical protein
MPFESKAQRRFMYAKHPEIAKRWQEHTPKGKKLPEKKQDKTASSAVDLVLIKHHLDDAEETKHRVVKEEALKDAHEYAKDFKDKIPNKDRKMLNSYGIHKQALANILIKNAKAGLWANVHAKRKRGEPPAKPGDKDFPDSKSFEKAQK